MSELKPSRIEVGKPMPPVCTSCGAIPVAGYCKVKGCPTSPSPSPVVEDDREAKRLAKVVIDALWPVLGGNHVPAETWEEISDAVCAALVAALRVR